MPVWCAANNYPLFSNVCHALKEYTIDFQIPLHSATDMSTSTALVNEFARPILILPLVSHDISMIDVPGLMFVLASTVRACAADPLDATQERNLAVDHLGRQAAMDDLISRACFFCDIRRGSKLERKVNGQQATCQWLSFCCNIIVWLYDIVACFCVSYCCH